MEEEVYKAKQKQLFKDRDTLRTSGKAVISFGMVSSLKTVLDITVGDNKITDFGEIPEGLSFTVQ